MKAVDRLREVVDRQPLWRYLDPPTWQGRLARDAILFGLTLIWALTIGIEARSLVWGLWLSSLLVGYTTILLVPVAGFVRAEGSGELVIAIGGGFFMIAFFTVHFCGFHAGHAVFLNVMFPLLEPGTGGGAFAPRFVAALAGLWPMVVVSAWGTLPVWRGLFRGPGLFKRGPQATGPADPTTSEKGRSSRNQMNDILFLPYKNVVRMHLLIFVFFFFKAIGAANLVVYPVLFAYFFPWKDVFRWRKTRPNSSHQQALASVEEARRRLFRQDRDRDAC